MRFTDLNLLAYGHFADRQLVFTPGETDLHIVFGANEAGKSTARSAIDDFLFGFPTQTPLNFRHAYNALRIGARIEAGAIDLEAIRKKGRKNTLLDGQGDAAPRLEDDLERQLAGADRAFFTRMFSLNHEGLRAGGETLAAANANADTALLSAGSGRADVLARRDALKNEADALWSPNHSRSRHYYQAEGRLKAADQAIREHEVTVGDWQRRREAVDTAEAHYQDLRQRRRDLDHQWRELERIRRVAQPARRYRETRAELVELDQTPSLDADARSVFDSACTAIETADATMQSIHDQIVRIDAEIDTLTDDPALREQAEVIEWLAEQRGRIVDDRERIAEIEAEQQRLDEALAANRAELGWPDREIAWPSAAAIEQARRLAGQYAAREQELSHARRNLDQHREDAQRLAGQAEQIGMVVDTSALAAWLAACTREGDLNGDARNAAGEVARLDRELERCLAELDPPVSDIAALAALEVPGRDRIEAFERDMAETDAAIKQHQQRLDELTDEVERAREAQAQRRADDALPSAEALAATRARRDRCWRLVRHYHGQQRGPDLFDDADTAGLDKRTRDNPVPAFERLMREADELADTRFDRAEAIARDAERQRHLAEREHALAQAGARRDEATARLESLRADWRVAWRPTALEPRSPAAMRDWLDRRTTLLNIAADRHNAAAIQDDLAARNARHRCAAMQHLCALGVAETELADASLAVIVERARRFVDTQTRRQDDHERVAAERRELETRRQRLQIEHKAADDALADWQQRWATALAPLGLAPEIELDAGQAALDTLESGRSHAARAREQASERNERVARQMRFAEQLAGVGRATGLAPRDNEDPEQTVQRLHAALRRAQSQYQTLQTRLTDRQAAQEQIVDQKQKRRDAERRIETLAHQAGVADHNALEAVIAQAERRQQLLSEQTALSQTLTEQGDGLAIEALLAAVEASDPDTLRDQITTLADQAADLDPELDAARDARNEARAAFDAIGGDERAAVAATERQTALADMGHAAERYLRVGTAALLLKWAGQRYAMDKQRPLIERGSVLMNQLTGGSFERLTGELDDNDELQIVGVRGDGSRVAPPGMSDGSRDQLYLALRIAAIEDYLQRAAPLPVVADDLFINFDDDRALAGLDVLAGLAEKTQVLFFTHHQHLRDMAVERLGARVQPHAL